MFKKSYDGKFAPGEPLGTPKGSAAHDASTSAIKDRLHNDTNPARSPVVSHGNQPSVGTPETLADVSAKGATTFTGKGG